MDISTKSDNQILILFDFLIFIKGLFLNLIKLRFENSTNKKNAQASLAFFLIVLFFVTMTGFKPVTS